MERKRYGGRGRKKGKRCKEGVRRGEAKEREKV